jgi:hypothetical protein
MTKADLFVSSIVLIYKEIHNIFLYKYCPFGVNLDSFDNHFPLLSYEQRENAYHWSDGSGFVNGEITGT